MTSWRDKEETPYPDKYDLTPDRNDASHLEPGRSGRNSAISVALAVGAIAVVFIGLIFALQSPATTSTPELVLNEYLENTAAARYKENYQFLTEDTKAQVTEEQYADLMGKAAEAASFSEIKVGEQKHQTP